MISSIFKIVFDYFRLFKYHEIENIRTRFQANEQTIDENFSKNHFLFNDDELNSKIIIMTIYYIFFRRHDFATQRA